MIKLALIDNGIPYHMRNNRNQRIVHKSFLASKCDPSEYKDDKSFHGAVCVGIITSICSDIELWDLNVTDSAGTTQITVLLEALEWCIQNKIKLIHMSLGTINYFDIKPLWYRICKMLCEYKKYFPGIICCLLGSSFITFIHPLLIRQITDCGILQKNMKYILLFSVILIIISLTQQELNIIQTKLFSNVHNQFTHSLYKKTYWKINRMKIQYFAERGSAEIINTIGMDIDNVSSVVDQITQFSISSILQIIGGVVGLSLLDWKLAILIEAIIPLKFIIVSYCANKKREVFEQWIEDKRKFMSWFAECINGIHEMKLWNLFQVKKTQFEGLQKDLMDSYKKNAMLDEYSTVSVVVIDTVVNALLYILSGLFIIKGEFTIGGAFAFITY